MVNVQLEKNFLDEWAATKVAAVYDFISIIIRSRASEFGVDWACSPGNLNQLDWTINLLRGIYDDRCDAKIGELGQVEGILAITIPVKIAEIAAIDYSDSAQVSQDALLNVLGHDFEVADISILISLEYIVELASTLLREIQSINLGVDIDSRSQVVRIVQERVMLAGLGAGL
jgi:hypothetical protein